MNIQFYASLRKITSARSVEFQLPPETTVREMIQAVILRFPEMRSDLLDGSGELDRHAHVFINGRDVPHLDQKMETILSDKDKIDVFPIGHF